MDIKEIQSRLQEDLKKIDLPSKELEIDSLTEQSQSADFWSNQELAKKTMQSLNHLKDSVSKWNSLKNQADSLEEIQPLLKEDEELAKDAQEQTESLASDLEKAEIELLFTGPYDKGAAFLSFAPGAGGTESKDFAEMLLRMYLRYAENNEYTATIVEKKAGDEAGIDSAMIKIEGPFAYGYLKKESGVHRLIRISPFNAQNLRQTSFVAIETMPEIPDNDKELDIPDKDLRIDTFRSGGAGGQHTNKTDSAVRITHLPTGIATVCQNERSQIQNKKMAMGVLKSRLASLMLEKHVESVNDLKPDHKKIEFGSQIRTYTLQPYTLAKDHRTNFEITDVIGVLDGSIESFLESNLRAS